MSNIQDALIQVGWYIKLEEDENLIGRQAAVTLNEEARKEERLRSSMRHKDRRLDYQGSENRFKRVRITRGFITLNTTVK